MDSKRVHSQYFCWIHVRQYRCPFLAQDGILKRGWTGMFYIASAVKHALRHTERKIYGRVTLELMACHGASGHESVRVAIHSRHRTAEYCT